MPIETIDGTLQLTRLTESAECPMCTDDFNGVALHVAENVDFPIAAAAYPAALREHAHKVG
jgi:hypothetical protein